MKYASGPSVPGAEMKLTSLSDVINTVPDCTADALTVSQAQQIIRAFVEPVDDSETVTLRNALGRVPATDIVSPIDVPPHDNAAMDGYALRSDALDGTGEITLRIIGTAHAGHGYTGSVAGSECVRIMTGAIMPAGCDTVVPQELVESASDTSVMIAAGVVAAGDNRRLKGEDLCAGKPALRKGRVMRPADIGLLASLGIAEVTVMRRIRVAIFSTGDELRNPGAMLDPGCVYDSNRFTLHGMLTRIGCEVIDMEIVKDDPASLDSALRSACGNADAIITSGGVSVGDADYTQEVMSRLGDVMFWKIAMRPGRPMAFGKIVSNGKSACLFGLPGNPVAVMATFYFFVRQALLRMMGADGKASPMMRVACQSAIRKKPGRTEFQRGVLSTDDSGAPQVRITGAQGSGILRSMSEADCFLVLPEDRGNINPGELVDVVLFDGLI